MAVTKSELRAGVRARRRSRTEAERSAAAIALRDRVLALPILSGAVSSVSPSAVVSRSHRAAPEPVPARKVAAYVSGPDEPGTGPLIEGLLATQLHVLVPVLLPDFDLDWGRVGSGSGRFAPSQVAGDGRLFEPDGPRLGPDAVGTTALVIVPALAVDRRGRRLGQGGGSYDRALGRIPAGIPIVALLFDDELLDDIPVEAHDRAVHFAVTPTRTVGFGAGSAGSRL